MKTIALTTCLSLALHVFAHAAEGPPTPEEQQLQATVAELRAQQAQMIENQTKIEAKLATINEALRLARILASRSGG